MRQPYPAYRGSGVEWFGDVPKHWQVNRLSRLTQCLDGRRVPLNAEQRSYRRGKYPYWGANGIVDHVDDWLFDEPLVLLGEDGAPFFARNKRVAFAVSGRIWVNNHAHVLRCLGVAQDYLVHLLNATDYAAFIDGSTRDKLTQDDMRGIPILVPPANEQTAIVAFLDSATARIDDLVAANRLLIERLDEYRTALITRTVTKGLPTEAARAAGIEPVTGTKPSGAGWLGDVPEHWEVVTCRRVFTERDERSHDGGEELLTVSHLTGVTRRSEKPDVGMFMADSLVDYKRCHAGDLVINTMWAWMGAAGVAPELGIVSPAYNVYTPRSDRLLPQFSNIVFRSRRYVVGMTSESRGIWSSRLRLYPQQFLSLPIALPTLREQKAIADHVEAVVSRSGRVADSVNAEIERLQEYRSALVTAVVTGKIDVRAEVSAMQGSEMV